MLNSRRRQALQRIPQARQRLSRQAINQISVDASKAGLARQLHRLQRLLRRMDASDCPQLAVLQRLYAEADAVKAKGAQRLQLR